MAPIKRYIYILKILGANLKIEEFCLTDPKTKYMLVCYINASVESLIKVYVFPTQQQISKINQKH